MLAGAAGSDSTDALQQECLASKLTQKPTNWAGKDVIGTTMLRSFESLEGESVTSESVNSEMFQQNTNI